MFSDAFFKGSNVPTSSIDQAAVQQLIDTKLEDLGSTLANTKIIDDLTTDVAVLIDTVQNKADTTALATKADKSTVDALVTTVAEHTTALADTIDATALASKADKSTVDALTTAVAAKGDKFAAYTIKQCDTAGDVYPILGVVEDFGKLILIQDGTNPVVAPTLKYTYTISASQLVANPDLPYSMTFYNNSDEPVEFLFNNENDPVLVNSENHAISIISRYNYVILSPRGSCTMKVLHQSISSKTVGANVVRIHPILLIGNLQATV